MIKKSFILLFLMIAHIAIVNAQAPVGKWWLGMIEEAMLPLNLTFAEHDNSVTAVLYSPTQSDEPIYPSKYELEENDLTMEVKKLGLKLSLTYSVATNTWEGRYKQGMIIVDIKFNPCDTIFKLNRPQTPQPPFPYDEEEVKVKRRKEHVTLTGTLTLPEKGRKFPAVLLVNGSGQQDRNSEIFKHQLFAVIADRLTRQGIAVLRYDDRGIGGSKGEVEEATTRDFAEDAMAMVDWLKNDKRIDKHNIGIIGHSEGGLIAQMIAAQSDDIAFIITLAGPGCSGKEILLQQNERIFSLAGYDKELIDIRLKFLEAMIYGDENAEDILKPLSKKERKELGLNKGAITLMKKQFEIPWWKTFATLNPSEYLSKIKCPILALNGAKDCQVISTENLTAIKRLAPHADTVEMKNLNHLMQHCKTGSVNEYILIDETIAEEVLQMMTNWILERKNER